MFPDYGGGSIVNLMSSIERALGGRPDYAQLRILKAEELRNSKNIVLIIIDGLGYNYLLKNAKHSTMAKNLAGCVTTVFPASTASAITTFLTGVAPQQHAVTGWFMNLKEIGAVTATLRFQPRYGAEAFGRNTGKQILKQKPFAEKIKAKAYMIASKEILQSGYNNILMTKTKPIASNNMADFFKKIAETTNKPGTKYIHAYWADLDKVLHHKGTRHQKTKNHLKRLDDNYRKMLGQIASNTTVILTSDHGFLDIKKTVKLSDHKGISDCLSMPLCGDARTKYCYIYARKEREFVLRVKNEIGRHCELYKSSDLLARGAYGIFAENPKLKHRIGDYTIIMKDGYVLKDSVLGEETSQKLAAHSGTSEDEMLVPLVVYHKT